MGQTRCPSLSESGLPTPLKGRAEKEMVQAYRHDLKIRYLKILVTGGSGFLGSHLCRRLCEEGSEVHATSRFDRISVRGGPTWWNADMADLSIARRVLAAVKPDIIYHFAGSVGARPDFDLVIPAYHSLLTSTVNLLVAGTEIGCRRVVLSGSFTEPLPGRTHPTPSSPYASAKWAASGYGRMFHSLFQTPVVILQPFMVYGPAQAPSKLIPGVIQSLLDGISPRVSSGKRRADWIYVSDVVDGFVSAATTPGIEGATIDLGSGSLVSIRGIVERLVAIVGTDLQPVFSAIPDRPDENEIVADTACASATLGWLPKTALESGLRKTVEWHRRTARGQDSD
jgi:UDP-glucose 4-epimerase